jgi:ribonuclease HI
MLFQFKFDGACNNNSEQKHMGIGVAVFADGVYYDDLSHYEGFKGDEESSSNVAEWKGCCAAFRKALEYIQSDDQVEIYSDSQLITNQFNGLYAIREEKFTKYFNIAKDLAKQAGLQNLKIKWIKRELNKEADKLSKIALQSVPNGKANKSIL